MKKKVNPLIIILSVLIIKALISFLVPAMMDNNSNASISISSKKKEVFLRKSSFRPTDSLVLEKNRIETTRLRVKKVYDSQLGVREATGRNDGPQVEAYLAYTGLGKGYAWCAAFVCWVLGQAEVENPKTAWAASLFPHDKLVWPRGRVPTRGSRTTNNGQPITKTACVFGLYFPSLKRIAHCGFIDEWGEKEVITVEGNTNDTDSREGDGVYRKRRPIKSLYAVADWIGKEAK